MKYYFQATPEIIPGETVVDVSGFIAWRNNLSPSDRNWIGYDPKYMQYEVDFGVGGGLRNVTKVASKAGLFTRFLRWLGIGNKAAPVTRTVKEIADELGYFPTKAVKEALKGQVARETIPAAERELAAKFYERVANEVVSGPKEAAAKALNLARAKFLREGGMPPIDIHGFEP